MTTTAPDTSFAAEQEAKRLRDQLHELLAAVLPFQWIEPTIAAVLSEVCPLVTPAAHSAAVRKEIDWQHHWMQQFKGAEILMHRLRAQVNATELTRVRAALADCRNVPANKTAKHDQDCWRRHAGCLARRIASRWAE